MKLGFDHEKYITEQSKYILERVNSCEKLYLEFGGKLMQDMHAKRVLPGFDPNAKIKLLQTLKEQVEIIICVYAGDIERNKVRDDFGITYDMDVLRLIDELRSYQLDVNSVVITRYDGQPATTVFMNKLRMRGIKTYAHKKTKGYPTDVDLIVSDEGYGANEYIETTKPIVVVTAPGPGSGKLATCLSQLYHEYRRGRSASYSKFETFPVWNVPLKHPLNVAYEAATVDLKDVNIIDSFHFDAYGVPAVNYNRDMEMFPVISRIIEKITGKESIYKSPTDMGVNRVGFGIIDDEVVKEASRQEIIRRYFKTSCEYKKGTMDEETFHRMDAIMKDMKLRPEDRKVVAGARSYAAAKGLETGEELLSATAIELEDGTIVTGRSSELMNSSAAAILNAVKQLAGIADEIHLISPVILQPIIDLKSKTLGSRRPALDCEEILMALSICAVTNPTAQVAMEKLPQLKNCQAHTTTILNRADEQTFRKLGVDVTCDPVFPSENLYYV
ncbi:DUF1846 domain-containing protein [Neobittarella massiliensis]|uniref:UPF0371 protein H8K20_10370 n=2 Tax=Oscillospiraceae TaxID=216572 RepID=A0A8J6LZJ8_9FIRM|nr:DUF1846 domain-containing protein [Neobittarella massiliensis]MBC3516798.1 DUF1846 domain-containing protein [Neobittarella massiliensis]SCJ79690.1 Uncharacterized protein conserved in bacteria [uncultured Anaerotruncus sp.]